MVPFLHLIISSRIVSRPEHGTCSGNAETIIKGLNGAPLTYYIRFGQILPISRIIRDGRTRQELTQKRSLHIVSEYFKLIS